MTSGVVHYQVGYATFTWAACGSRSGEITARPLKVTCKRCKGTKDYREMVEEEPL